MLFNTESSEKITNEEVLERMGHKRTLLNNIFRKKGNCIGHFLRRNCLLHEAIGSSLRSSGGIIALQVVIPDSIR